MQERGRGFSCKEILRRIKGYKGLRQIRVEDPSQSIAHVIDM